MFCKHAHCAVLCIGLIQTLHTWISRPFLRYRDDCWKNIQALVFFSHFESSNKYTRCTNGFDEIFWKSCRTCARASEGQQGSQDPTEILKFDIFLSPFLKKRFISLFWERKLDFITFCPLKIFLATYENNPLSLPLEKILPTPMGLGLSD